MLSDNIKTIQRTLYQLATEVSKYGTCFTRSKCKVLLAQDWQEPMPTFALCDGRLEAVNSFKYLGSPITSGRGVAKAATSRTAKARATFVSLWTCDTAMTFGFPTREGYTVQQFIMFCFTVAIFGLSALRMHGDFLFSITDDSEALLVSSVYIQ